MKTRREVIRLLGAMLMKIPLFLGAFGSFVSLSFAKAKRLVLPENTPMSDLVSRNPAELDTRQLSITPMNEFDVMGQTVYPVDMKQWRLELSGQMAAQRTFSYAQLLALPAVERKVLLICPGFFAYHALWKGVSMPALLKSAGMKKETTHIQFGGPLGINENTTAYPIEDVLSNKIFLAFQVNGVPLPERHGFPLRLVAEDHFGDQWTKYITRVSAVIKTAGPGREELLYL